MTYSSSSVSERTDEKVDVEEPKIISFPLSGLSAHEIIEQLNFSNGDVEDMVCAIKWRDGTVTTGWSNGKSSSLIFMQRVLTLSMEDAMCRPRYDYEDDESEED